MGGCLGTGNCGNSLVIWYKRKKEMILPTVKFILSIRNLNLEKEGKRDEGKLKGHWYTNSPRLMVAITEEQEIAKRKKNENRNDKGR